MSLNVNWYILWRIARYSLSHLLCSPNPFNTCRLLKLYLRLSTALVSSPSLQSLIYISSITLVVTQWEVLLYAIPQADMKDHVRTMEGCRRCSFFAWFTSYVWKRVPPVTVCSEQTKFLGKWYAVFKHLAELSCSVSCKEMTTKALEEQRKRVSSRQGDIPSLKSICAKLRRQRNFTCSKRVWKPMLLVIRRDLRVLFAEEEGVVKEGKMKKRKKKCIWVFNIIWKE